MQRRKSVFVPLDCMHLGSYRRAEAHLDTLREELEGQLSVFRDIVQVVAQIGELGHNNAPY